MKALLGFILVGALLTGCYPREEVAFATDLRILRGVWEGNFQDASEADQATELRLELAATYLSRTKYSFSGTIQLGDDTPQLIQGTAFGGQWEVYTQSTLIPPALPSGFFAHIPALGLRLCGYGGSSVQEYYGVAATADSDLDCPARPYGYNLEPFDYHFSIERSKAE